MLDRAQLHLPGDHLPRPHGNCYWLVPGQIMAGEYPKIAAAIKTMSSLPMAYPPWVSLGMIHACGKV